MCDPVSGAMAFMSVMQVQQQQQAAQQQMLMKQAGQLASAPMADPTKNPDAQEQANRIAENLNIGSQQPPEE